MLKVLHIDHISLVGIVLHIKEILVHLRIPGIYIAIRVKTEFRLGVMSACMDVNMMDLLPNPFCFFMSGYIESLFVKRRL